MIAAPIPVVVRAEIDNTPQACLLYTSERKAEKVDMGAAGEAPANKGKKKATKARLDKSDEEAINAAKAAAFIKEDEEA